MSRDAIVPEEWVEAAYKAGWEEDVGILDSLNRNRICKALEAVIPLAEQRATRSLLKAREEAEGR